MKLNIQNRLLLPIIGVILIIMGSSTWITNDMVADQLEDNFYNELNAVNKAVMKGVSTATDTYENAMNTAADDTAVRAAVEAFANHGKLTDAEQVAASNAIHRYLKSFNLFTSIGLLSKEGTIIAATVPSNLGQSRATRKYFGEAMQGKFVISEPLISGGEKLKAVITAAPVKDAQGNTLGVLFAVLPTAQLVSNCIDGVKIGQTGYPFLVDKSGLMLAHPNEKLIQTFNANTSEWGKEAMPKGTGRMSYHTQAGLRRLMDYQKEPHFGWLIVSAIDATEIENVTGRLRNFSLGIMALGVLLITLTVFLIVRPIIRDLLRGVHFASTVAKGNLNEELNVKRNDELGVLFDALHDMVSNLKKYIANAEDESRNARENSTRAEQAMREAEAAGKDAQTKSEGMQRAAVQLEEVVQVVSSASEELSAQIEQSEHGASEQAGRITDTATAMEEMTSTVREVARSAEDASHASALTRSKAEDGAKLVHNVVESITTLQEQSLALKEDMNILNTHANAINEIMGVISDIADQTNLLALNAAIEAARAGDAGRGFAVVADEVRKLAEKTMHSTTDVGNAIKSIQESATKNQQQVDMAVSTIHKVTEMAKESGTALAEIVEMVDSTAEQVRSIATASEQQSATSEEINQSVTQINGIASETSRAMQEAARAVSELAAQSQRLMGLVEDMRRI